ncbi:MAG: glycosyltransferase family 4 protein [Alphaproteobacteria bacterium]
MASVTGPVAFVLKGYPRLSETFIAQEIRALEARGLDIRIVSLRRPTDPATHPIHREIRAPVLYLPEYLYQEPLRVLRGWRAARKLPGYRAAQRLWWRDLRRDATPNRIRRFGQALVLATEAPTTIVRLHAHFMHTPGSVARYAAVMRGLPFSFSAHAKDIWTIPTWEKREKLADADWVVTCTAGHRDHLAGLAPVGRVALSYHGLDLERFPPAPGSRAMNDGSDPYNPVVILSVGRAVEKKGYDILLQALARIPATVHWRFVHVGGGALSAALRGLARDLHVADHVDFRGALAQADVLQLYREADLFVLASRVAQSGDRDGLPNVLMEAQSQGLACIASDTAAIPELIADRETGRLVPPDRPQALADALVELISDPTLRVRLGAAGERRVRTQFGIDPGLAVLAERFGLRRRLAAE